MTKGAPDNALLWRGAYRKKAGSIPQTKKLSIYSSGRPVFTQVPLFLGDGPALLVVPPLGRARQAYLKTVEVFFCPSDEIRRPHRDENGWAKNTLNGTVYDSVSYWYWATPKDWTTHPANANKKRKKILTRRGMGIDRLG